MVFIFSEDQGFIDYKKRELSKKYSNVKNFYFDDNLDELSSILLQIDLFNEPNSEIVFINNFVFSNDKKSKDFLEEISKVNNKKIVFTSFSSKPSKNVENLFTDIYDLKKLNKWTMKKFVENWIKENKIFIFNNALEELLKKLPSDVFGIESELSKLLCWSKSKIDTNLVNNIICEDINQNIFNLIDNYFNNNYELMINQIRVFESKKIDFKEIFYVLVSQLFTLKLYVSHFNQYQNLDKIALDFSVMKFQVEKWAKLIYNISLDIIDRLLLNLLKLELESMKGERDLAESLKLFLFNGV